MMKNKVSYILLICMLALFTSNSYAEIGKRPRVGLSYTDYDLEFSSSSESISSTNYLTLELGLTLLDGSIFYDVAYSTSLSAQHDFTPTGQDDDFTRNDFALAVGYLLGNHWSVFGGYKFGESEYSNYADGVAPNTKLVFETEGLFGGASKVFPMGQNALSLTASIAILDGDLWDNDTGATPLNATGDAIGLSVGAAYSVSLQNNMGLVAKMSYQNYDFSDLKDPVYTPDDLTESILSIGATFFMDF